MKRSTDRMLTTHPGRLPDPPVRDEAMQARSSGDRKRFDELLKAGAITMFEKQRSVGVDIMSDGEFWKARDQLYYGSRATGIEALPLKPGEWPSTLGTQRERTGPEFREFYAAFDRLGNTPRPGAETAPIGGPPGLKSVMVGEVKALPATSIKEDIAVIKTALEAAGVDVEDYFYPVLGPGWLDHFVWNEHYKTEEEYCFALAEIVKNDMKAVVDAGFVLQVDDPGLCDRWGMIEPAPSYDEYRRQENMRVEATNYALQGIPEDRVRYHTCWGSWHTPHTTDIPFKYVIDLMLKINAGAYSIEAADVQHELDYEVWADHKLPDGKLFIPGVIAHKTTTIEPPELVAHRLVQWAALFGRENVIGGVDCGVGGRSYPEVGWAKLKALSDGAALASKALWAKG
jgi:5-methyltetrahydropteroyltriglutamate--homocysteine methyltransferase